MKDLEMVSFKVISAAGAAKSMFMESIQAARQNDFDKAQSLIEEGEKMRIKGHEAHFELIQKEASGESVEANLLLIHAEDQLMASETIKILAEEIIENLKRIVALETLVQNLPTT